MKVWPIRLTGGLLALWMYCTSASGDMRAPPRPASPASTLLNENAATAYTSQLGLLGLYVYQNGLRRCIASRCPMAPSCSNYARDAVHRHGAFLGTVLTADRLLHEKTEVMRLKKILDPTRGRYVQDPVERHTAWWPASGR